MDRSRSNGVDSESVTTPLTGNPCKDKPDNIAWGGEFAKSIVYGGMDAIVTSFSLVSSISGGRLSSGAVLVLGFANLIADGISMGFGDFVSSTAERDMAANRKHLTDWEVCNDPRSQIMNLISEYQKQGMSKKDAKLVVDTFAKYNGILVDHKLTMEEGLISPDEESSPWRNGVVTFLSFLSFGCTPLLAYVILNPFTKREDVKFGAACGVTALALILLGLAKAKISGQKYLNSVLVVLVNGSLAAAAAYFLSWLLNHVFGIED